jgi:hypothetical protein
VRDLQAMEPDLSLLEPKRSNLVPILLVVTLCVLGIAALVLSPPTKPRKLPPAPPAPPAAARTPLYVTVVPATDDGWCCTAGQLSAATRARCTAAAGTFFASEAEGRKGCPTTKSGSPRGRGTGT